MKKRVVALMLGVMIALAAVGCGKEKNGAAEGTEAVESTENTSSVVSASGAFDLKAADYVKLCDYDGIEVTITGDYDVADEDVTAYFTQMFDSYGPFYKEDPSKKVIEEGDIVNVDYVGKLDGEAFDGGTAEGQLIDVYNNTSADGNGYIEGFTEGLKNASVGDVIDCDVTFPENYGNEELAGKGVVFTFTVNSIQKAMTIEDVDDAFAKEQFQAETVDDMYEQIKTYLKSAADYNKDRDTYTALQDYLLNNCTVEVPEDYLAARVSDYKKQFIESNCGGDESKLEEFLSTNYQMTVEDADTEWTEGLRKNISLELVLEAIAEKEKIEPDEKEYAEYINSSVTNNGYESEAALYETYGYGDAAFGEKYVKQLFVDQKALDMVKEAAVITVDTKAAGEDADAGATEILEGTEVTEVTENAE